MKKATTIVAKKRGTLLSFASILFIFASLQQQAMGQVIPDAYTDRTPAATVFRDQFYIAFKDRGSDRIRLATTIRPGNPSSWEIIDLPSGFPGEGPGDISTDFGPALSAHGGRLWLIFKEKGIDNPNIGIISMTASRRWAGYGFLSNARTSNAPAMASNLIVHRGDRTDNSIRYTYHSVSPPPRDTEIRRTRSNSSPAVAFWPPGRPIIAYSFSNEIFITQREHTPVIGWGWTEPEEIRGASSSEQPALAMHGDFMYVAFKDRTSQRVWIGIYNGSAWILHGTLPGCNTSQGPALVSFDQNLYVVYVEATTGEVSYAPVPTPTIEPLTVMTLNVRIHPKGLLLLGIGDDRPHSWSERLPRIETMLRSYEAGQGPDVVGMQEVRAGQCPELVDRLEPAYGHFWVPREGRFPWENPDEGLALFYKNESLELLDSGSQIMTWDGRRRIGDCGYCSIFDACFWKRENRVIIWGHFRYHDDHTERTFYVYNTHFGGTDCQKEGQALILADLIASRTHSTDPVIVMGDFNTGYQIDHGSVEEQAPFGTLRRSTGLVNSYERIHPYSATGYFSTVTDDYHNKRRGKMIDFVLVSPSFQIYDADIDRTMFNQSEVPATVPCYEVDSRGWCTNVGDMSDYFLMYSDHWAVWTSLLWFPD